MRHQVSMGAVMIKIPFQSASIAYSEPFPLLNFSTKGGAVGIGTTT